jgi:hypothetical protein
MLKSNNVVLMTNMRWLAINVMAPDNPSGKEDLLMKTHAEVISLFKTKLESWHFLWEGAPFTHTLLLRFYGDLGPIEELKKALVNLFEKDHLRWESDEKYEGEASTYGSKGWEYLTRVLHLGSDFAIAVIENERRNVKNEGLKWSLSGYLERWIHLFMNQLHTRVKEADTLLQLSVHRRAINMLGEEQYRRISRDLDEELRQLIPQFYEETIAPLIKRLRER